MIYTSQMQKVADYLFGKGNYSIQQKVDRIYPEIKVKNRVIKEVVVGHKMEEKKYLGGIITITKNIPINETKDVTDEYVEFWNNFFR